MATEDVGGAYCWPLFRGGGNVACPGLSPWTAEYGCPIGGPGWRGPRPEGTCTCTGTCIIIYVNER